MFYVLILMTAVCQNIYTMQLAVSLSPAIKQAYRKMKNCSTINVTHNRKISPFAIEHIQLYTPLQWIATFLGGVDRGGGGPVLPKN